MTIRTITVPMYGSVDPTGPLNAALSLARRLDAHIDAVLIRPDPITTVAEMGDLGFAAAVTLEDLNREAEQLVARSRERFIAWAQAHEVATELRRGRAFARWIDHVGWPEEAIVQHGRLSDLLVMNLPGFPGDPSAAAFE